MADYEQTERKLLAVIEEAFPLCIRLRDYSQENMNHFESSSDEEIIQAIGARESYINQLLNLECQFNQIIEEAGVTPHNLPRQVADAREDVRAVLKEIAQVDNSAITVLSGKIQTYKNDALKASSKKQLSAYLQASMWSEFGQHF